MFPACGLSWETAFPSNACQRAFGVPSIYQPLKTPAPSESQRFTGLLAHFLETCPTLRPRHFYMVWYMKAKCLLVVCTAERMLGHWQGGN